MSGYEIPDDMLFYGDDHTDAANSCTSEWDVYYCTRTSGHDGVHEAGTSMDGGVVVAVWRDEVES